MNVRLNKISQCVRSNIFSYRNVRYYCKTQEDDMKVPTNPLKNVFGANDQTTNGIIYDKKPFKYTCEAGKRYSWCLCGRSHKQPFCDGTHRQQELKITQRPVHFTVTETKSYWLCNCKQTSNRPFCDGTHLNEEIQGKK